MPSTPALESDTSMGCLSTSVDAMSVAICHDAVRMSEVPTTEPVCIGMCVDMCADMCIDMCIDMRVDMRIHMEAGC